MRHGGNLLMAKQFLWISLCYRHLAVFKPITANGRFRHQPVIRQNGDVRAALCYCGRKPNG